MVRLHRLEAGEGADQAQPVGVARVDPGDEGLGDLLQGFVAEAAPDEVTQGLVPHPTPRQRQIQTHADLPRPGQEAAAGERQELGGDHQHGPLGQGMQVPVAQDVGRGDGRSRTDLEARVAGQAHARRFLTDEAVRPALDEEAFRGPFGHDVTAGAVGRLVDGQTDLPALFPGQGKNPSRRRQAGDATAHHGDAHRVDAPPTPGPPRPGPGLRRSRPLAEAVD